MPDNLSQTQANQPVSENQGRCEVCNGPPPPGHRFCDNCWPEAAIKVGKAKRCEICGLPKVIEKLKYDSLNRLICSSH